MIIEIIRETMPVLAKKRTASELGDRATYIGASDVGGACIRKAVLSKLEPVDHDLSTLIKFERGHLTEIILTACFDEFKKYKYVSQKEVIHPQNPKLKCHIDFMFHNKNLSKILVVECKSVSAIPDEPYDSWVSQVQFQMGLLKLNYPDSVIKGSIIAIDLNTGKIAEFSGYKPNDILFATLLQRAGKIQAYVETEDTRNLPVSDSLLCGFCSYKTDCSLFSGSDPIPDDLKATIGRYKKIQEKQKELKKQIDAIKADILPFTGNDYHAKWDGNKISVSIVKARKADTKALKSEYPDVYSSLLKTSESVRIRIT